MGCCEPAQSALHQPTVLIVFPNWFSFLSVINSVLLIDGHIKCHAIMSSRGKHRWSRGRRAQHPAEALQDQASKWLQFSDNLAHSTCEMYPWTACLQLPLMHTSSASKTPYVFFSSAPDGGCDTRGLSFFHAIHTGLDRVKKKGTSTLDRPAKRALKTPHPASANCTKDRKSVV